MVSFDYWDVRVKVWVGGHFVGEGKFKLLAKCSNPVEFYLCGIKFMLSSNPEDAAVDIYTASSHVILSVVNSWASGLVSEPINYNHDEVTWDMDVTAINPTSNNKFNK